MNAKSLVSSVLEKLKRARRASTDDDAAAQTMNTEAPATIARVVNESERNLDTATKAHAALEAERAELAETLTKAIESFEKDGDEKSANRMVVTKERLGRIDRRTATAAEAKSKAEQALAVARNAHAKAVAEEERVAAAKAASLEAYRLAAAPHAKAIVDALSVALEHDRALSKLYFDNQAPAERAGLVALSHEHMVLPVLREAFDRAWTDGRSTLHLERVIDEAVLSPTPEKVFGAVACLLSGEKRDDAAPALHRLAREVGGSPHHIGPDEVRAAFDYAQSRRTASWAFKQGINAHANEHQKERDRERAEADAKAQAKWAQQVGDHANRHAKIQ